MHKFIKVVEGKPHRIFNTTLAKIIASLFFVSFLFLGYTAKADTPTSVVFQDNFDNDSLDQLGGQNGWGPAQAGAGTWQVQVGDQGNQVQATAGSSNYPVDLRYQSTRIGDSLVQVDFKASATAEPDVWLRRDGTSSSANGYFLLNETGGTFLIFSTAGGGARNLGGASTTITVGNWYTIAFQVVNDGSGNPVLSAWVYPQGSSRPGSPLVTRTDTQKDFTSPGYVAIGSNDPNSITNFDNFLVYSGDPQSVPGSPANLQITPQPNQLTVTWQAPFNGGSPITDYNLQYRTGSGSYSTFAHAPSSTFNSAVITGLTGADAYDVHVSAINALGSSTPATGSGTPTAGISITSPARAVASTPLEATSSMIRTVSDDAGGGICASPFYIPYIQTSSSLTVSASVAPANLPSGGGVKFVLDQGQSNQQTLYSNSAPFTATFTSVQKGEHTLDTYVVDSQNNISDATQHDHATNIGIGDIYGVIGDSVGDGFYGTVHAAAPDWTTAAVKSNDNRNYSSCANTMSDGYIELNNDLETVLGYPVFIFQEGVSGATSSTYVSLIGASNWQSDINNAKPNKWLIHLGINDGGPNGSVWQTNIQQIITALNTTYNAEKIFLATPATGTGWGPYVNSLVSGNSHVIIGPDFNTFYTNYPALKHDGLHPTEAGQIHMGYLWANSIAYPQNVSVSQNGNTATVSWNNLSLSSSVLSTAGYKVSYGTSSGNYTTIVDAGNVTTKNILGLTGGQTYYFVVSAYDNDSFSPNPGNNSPELAFADAAISVNPSSIIHGTTGNQVVITGVNASWTAGTPGSPIFTLSGGTGASITARTITDPTHAILTISAGSATGALTITDPSKGTTTTVNVVLSNDDTVASSAYTIRPLTGSAGTITNVPFGTPKATFLNNLAFASGATQNLSSNLGDPLVSNNTLVVTAEDGVTTATYTITVNARGGGGGGGPAIVYTPAITIRTPASGAVYNAGLTVGFDWTPAYGAFTKYKISYSTDNGTNWTMLSDSTTSTNLSWVVPNASTTQGKIKVEGYDSSGNLLASSVSTGNFMINGTIPAANPTPANPTNTPITTTPTPPPAIDSTSIGTYLPSTALANTPDIATDKGLTAPPADTTVYCTAGSLIKGSFPAVYYCGIDGKRYVFVNSYVYFTWYGDFSTVKILSDIDLAKIPLGGNITYRPGVKMVKAQTDPKVYTVSRGGLLRWISSETIARQLYGEAWNKMIDYIPDAFWSNYKFGASIN
jgi:hypothetical protein